jgi:hypothetical protein
MPATIRITETAHAALREVSARHRVPMQTVLNRAVEAYRRQVLLEELNAAYAALRQDPNTWSELEEERAAWDPTLMDGLVEQSDLEPGGEGRDG